MRDANGSILLLTLWVIALLSIMAYALMARVRMGLREEAWAQGEMEAQGYLAALGTFAMERLKSDEDPGTDSFKDEWGKAFDVTDSAAFLSQYEGVAPTCTDFTLSIQPADECGKINVNTANNGLLAEVLKECGVSVPLEIVEAIVDWRDADDAGQSEAGYYDGLTPPYGPRNDNLKRIEELLCVRGISPQLFYGEDENHNWRLDPNEDDGDASFPRDNGDGTLQPGLVDLLTVFGEGEGINVNCAPKQVLEVVLRLALEDDVKAETVAKKLWERQTAEEATPFRDGQELKTYLEKSCGLDTATAEGLSYGALFASTAFRFRLRVEKPAIHLRASAELVVSRNADTGEIVIEEWRDM